MTPAIYQEWNQHQSLFAKKWLRCMIAKKKMITGVNLTKGEIKQLHDKIDEFDTSSNKVKAMLAKRGAFIRSRFSHRLCGYFFR